MTIYFGILDGSGDVWGVRVPDVPGCHGGGSTPEAAIADAVSALNELVADGIDSRAPRTLAALAADPVVYFKPRSEAFVALALTTPQRKKAKAFA